MPESRAGGLGRPEQPDPFDLRPALRPTPCRLFVLLARSAPLGVLFRRGPTDWVQLIGWDVAHDTFSPGQWFHGRVWETRSDLSPDGTKLIYFAAKPPRGALDPDGYSYAWTAISRPPYYTALVLWPKRASGTYFGGGLFISNAHIWLNHPGCEAEPHPDHRPPRALEVTPQAYDPRYDVGYYRRLERDGWQVDRSWWDRHSPTGFVGAPRALHEKAHPHHALRLAMESDVFYHNESPDFSLLDERRGELTALPGATWADWDQRCRLVYAKGGKLLAAAVGERGLAPAVELADFNEHRPARLPSPEWARKW